MLVKIDIKSQGNFLFEIKEGMVPVFSFNLTSMGFTRSITTQKYGIHNFCFKNQGSARARIGFQIVLGSKANDYSSPADNDELLAALENQGKIAEEFIQDIVLENT